MLKTIMIREQLVDSWRVDEFSEFRRLRSTSDLVKGQNLARWPRNSRRFNEHKASVGKLSICPPAR